MLTMLAGNQIKLMHRIQVKRHKLRGYNKLVCLKIQQKLENYSKAACDCILRWNGVHHIEN